MSHTTTIRGVKIRDEQAIRAAVRELREQGIKVDLLENAKPRMYSEPQANAVGTCAYVLRLENSRYDVALKKQEDGTFAPVFDEWANQVGSQLGSACPSPYTSEGKAQHQIGKFMQAYGKHAVINKARSMGQSVQDVRNVNGKMVITLTGY